jgi:alpha-tubulin suppressor-like RCC1 family protein
MREVVSLREKDLVDDRVVQAIAGASHTLLVTASGAVLAFGSNIKVLSIILSSLRVLIGQTMQGQLGVGEKSDTDDDERRGQLRRVLLPPGLRVAMCAGGGIHSVAVTTCGAVLTWGHNGQGQLGLGRAAGEEALAPCVVAMPGGAAAAVMTAAGFGHSVVLTADGAVYAFGRGDVGQLGLGRRDNVFEPARVDSLAGMRVR